jgi:putative endonuclease
MKTCFVDILKCSDGLTYTGFTNNISRRFEELQNGLNKIVLLLKEDL